MKRTAFAARFILVEEEYNTKHGGENRGLFCVTIFTKQRPLMPSILCILSLQVAAIPHSLQVVCSSTSHLAWTRGSCSLFSRAIIRFSLCAREESLDCNFVCLLLQSFVISSSVSSFHVSKHLLWTSFAMDIPHLDSSLWSLLPENLIELVLARLPVANLLRLRSVCKKWSGLLANKSFLAACSEVNSNEPYFAKLSYPEDGRWLMSYDPSRSRWYNVSIGYFPRTVGIPLSSSGGLICFVNNTRDSGSRRHGPVLFVSNPMTKEWKELPRGFPWEESPEYEETPLVSLIMCKRPSHYKVIVVETGCTQIFDSVDGGWRKTKCLIREGVLRKESVRKAVLNVHNLAFCNGSLYLLTPSNCTLMAFSIQDEVWSRVQSDRLPGHPKFRNLTTCNGHVVMVGRSEQQEQVVSMCVWFLEWKTMKWLEGGRMPQHMSQLMMSDAMRCCVVLQFSSYGDSILFDSSRHDLSFLFNMAKGTWCSVEHWPNSCQSIAFEPRLDAQV